MSRLRRQGRVGALGHGQSHKFLTLAYQIEADCVRLLWVGKDRTKLSFEKFFTLIGEQVAGKVEFVCSDTWRPYLEIIAKHCPQALNILDRFHMVAKLNKALDEVVVPIERSKTSCDAFLALKHQVT
jgi:transposase